MIEILKKEIEKFETSEGKFNHLREILQILILKIIYDCGFFKNLVFTGGTALRVLFDMRRFSEDLDFSLVNREGYKLPEFSQRLKSQIFQYRLEADMKENDKKTVHQIDVKFRSILFDLALSDLPEQKLFIRIEVDTNPPEGGKTEVTLINKIFVFSIAHFGLPSLFATKLCACFFRKYTKGRDFYDLLWHLTRREEPNYRLLNNAIKQVHKGEFVQVNKNNFKKFLARHLKRIDFAKVRKDVERFLEDKREIDLINKENFLNLTDALK